MLKKTALHAEHLKLNAKMIDFGGWDLPVQYTSVIQEHRACRNTAGLFDVSHMGEITVRGPDAEAFINFVITNDISTIKNGQAQYTVMCREDAGIIDDLIVYKKTSTDYFIVVNAANTEKDFNWFLNAQKKFPGNYTLKNESSEWSQIAIQGPNALKILKKITNDPIDTLSGYFFLEGTLLNTIPSLIARTGYTGEDGFELYLPNHSAGAVWHALLEHGTLLGLTPCGLAARDTLRLEVKFPLYGNELSEQTNPLEAGLGWVVKLQKTKDFIGKDALIKIKNTGTLRSLVGLKLLEPGIPRQGYKLFDSNGNDEIGMITSGTQSPMTKDSIAMAYIKNDFSTIGTPIKVEVRSNKIKAEIVKTPFYKKSTLRSN